MSKRPLHTGTPDWALRISDLMKALGLTRAKFAERFGITEMTVSNWLTGKKQPSAKIYFRMAQLTRSAEEAAPFLKLAADRSDLNAPGVHTMFEPRKKPPVGVHIGYIGGDAVGVRLLKDPAAAGTPRAINEKDVDEVLPLPKSLCPNADHLVCIRVEGDSMSPILEVGYIVAIDTSQVDPRRLHGNMVAARAPDGGVTIKWLRKAGKDLMLIPQHTSMRHQPVVLPATEEDHGWSIVGRVLWWLGTPPK